jgi:hypothetical protein
MYTKKISNWGGFWLVVAGLLTMTIVWAAMIYTSPYTPRNLRNDLDSLEKRVEALEQK